VRGESYRRFSGVLEPLPRVCRGTPAQRLEGWPVRWVPLVGEEPEDFSE
jgi:hypothetical protein